MLIWSRVKNWRPLLARQGLPASVSIGIRLPWVAMNFATYAAFIWPEVAKHIQRTHRPYKICYVCRKRTGTFPTLRKVNVEARLGPLPLSFFTTRGLSNHKRILYPESYTRDAQTRSGRNTIQKWEPVAIAYLEGLVGSQLPTPELILNATAYLKSTVGRCGRNVN